MKSCNEIYKNIKPKLGLDFNVSVSTIRKENMLIKPGNQEGLLKELGLHKEKKILFRTY